MTAKEFMKKILFSLSAFLMFNAFCFAWWDYEDRPFYEGYDYYYDGQDGWVNGYPWPPPSRIEYKAYFQQNSGDLEEMYSLQARKAAEDAYDQVLTLITVPNAKIYSVSNAPKAEITVNNNSQYSIKKVYFIGAVISKNTNKIIADGSFSYVLPNTLLPLNKEICKIPLDKAFNIQHSDMFDFQAKVVGIDTADGQRIQSGAFTSADEQQLEELQKDYR